MNGLFDQSSLWAINVLIHATMLTSFSLLLALLFRKTAVMRYWVLCCGMFLVLGSPVISALIQVRGNSWLSVAAPASPIVAIPVAAHAKPLPTRDSLPDRVATADPFRAVAEKRADAERVVSTTEDRHSAIVVPRRVLTDHPNATTNSKANWMSRIIAALVSVWAVGAIVLLLRMLIGWVRLTRILRRSELIESAQLQAAFDQARRVVGCRMKVAPSLVASSEVSGPIAAGLFGGYVVLPKSLIEQVDAADLGDVLIHEVAHLARRDQIVVLVQNLVAAIYWPHPLVKLLNRELAKAREEVCDNFVLGNTDAPQYSRTLLSLADLVQRSETIPGTVGFFTDRWRLEQRVAGLLDERRDRRTILGKRGWAFVAASALALITLVSVGTITIATAQSSDKAQSTDKDSDNTPELEDAPLTIRGIVRGPNGTPIGGARVIALEHHIANTSWTSESTILAETTSSDTGAYTLRARPTNTRFSNGKYLESQYTSVLATHAGFGLDEQAFLASDPQVDLQLSTAKQVISGQILNLKGQPIKNVRVRLQEIQQPQSTDDRAELVDNWIEAAKKNPSEFDMDSTSDPFSDPFGGNTSPPKIAFYPTREKLIGVGAFDIETHTDREGRFNLPDIGDDRLAVLRIDGTGIASTLLPVVTREMAAVNSPNLGPIYRTGKTFGSNFTVSAEPSQVVKGVVRDRESGKPVVGATIRVHQLPDDLQLIDGFLSATSDADGRYELSGLPRNAKETKRPSRIGIDPPNDQPYFRSTHDVPLKKDLDPIDFDIALTRGVWITGQVTEAESGKPVTGIVGYHPYIDNKNAADHEAFNPRVTSMGYEEMFATDSIGNFRVPALRGKGVLRVVASNDDEYKLVAIPGTKFIESGSTIPDKRKIYHTIMPGNGVVDVEIDAEANSVELNVELERLKTLNVHVVYPDGSDAKGFHVAGRRISKRLTLSGRGTTFWEDEPSPASTIDVRLGEGEDRDRPLMILDRKRQLGAVVWLGSVDKTDDRALTVQLKPCAKIVGKLVGRDSNEYGNVYVQAGVGEVDKINAMFQTRGGGRVKVSKHLNYPVHGVAVPDDSGNFEIAVPPSDRYSVILTGQADEPTLLENETLQPGVTLDFGTIDLKADPKTWPKLKITGAVTKGPGVKAVP